MSCLAIFRDWQRAAALGATLAFGACDSKVPPPKGLEVQHPNGLRLTLPEGYRATPTQLGFVVEPAEGQRRRYEVRVSVTWLPGAPPEVRKYQWRRTLAPGRVVHYWSRQTGADADGGSGGPEYELSACEQMSTGSVCLHQARQTEFGVEVFELWQIARDATFRAQRPLPLTDTVPPQ